MKFFLMLFSFVFLSLPAQNQMLTPFEKGNGNQTTTYEEMLKFYEMLDKNSEKIKIFPFAEDDNGEKINVVVFDENGVENSFNSLKNKAVVLINNGIHPGEPDGIDATMMMMRDLVSGKIKAPKNTIVAAIECYNISGMLRRGKYSRANQNGPEEYGFRGNARNFDLNRDFIKTDSKNARAFQKIFQTFQPDFFIDNHVSNGADYQYLFTHITTNKERLGKILGDYFHQKMQPDILKKFDKDKILYTPYVNIHGYSPDEGFPAFMDSPRYATGYTALFNVPGTVAETHMLKKYSERVRATYLYMVNSIAFVDANFKELKEKRIENLIQYQSGKKYAIQWKTDSANVQNIDFLGFEAGKKPSEISGKPRLFYDRNKPFSRKVKFYGNYLPTKEIVIPKYYVVPASQWQVSQAFLDNNIKMEKLPKDTVMNVEVYKIEKFNTVKNPYEGHYLHFGTEVSSAIQKVKFRKGDFLVSTAQPGVKYILETLEPEAVDSFFSWNFFDSVLGQKEYYSDYVFEDTAAELLKKDPNLKTAFEKKKKEDLKFADDGAAQLEWMYRNSPYYEGTVNQYPIFRIK